MPLADQHLVSELDLAITAILEARGHNRTKVRVLFEDGKVTVQGSGLKASASSSAPLGFEERCRVLGLPNHVFGQLIDVNGGQFRVKDVLLNRPKFPVLVERVGSGKEYVLSVQDVLGSLPGFADKAEEIKSQNFLIVARRHNVPEKAFHVWHQSPRLNGRAKLVDGRPGARKNCFVLMTESGSSYCMSAEDVIEALTNEFGLTMLPPHGGDNAAFHVGALPSKSGAML